ncbi:hypothetical protein BGZ93_009676 [Podila epicladia]|nr:hypothetical protein BGZ93_009676 [Podila epicladia]
MATCSNLYSSSVEVSKNMEQTQFLARHLFLLKYRDAKYHQSKLMKQFEIMEEIGVKAEADGKTKDQILNEFQEYRPQTPVWDYKNTSPSGPHQPILPQRKNFSDHTGYDLIHPKEFFQTYGSYILMILKMVRQGFSSNVHEIPSLDNLAILWGIDLDGSCSHITKDTIGMLVCLTINYLEGLSLPRHRSEVLLNERECVAVKHFLIVPSGSNTLGGLYKRTSTRKWFNRHLSTYIEPIQRNYMYRSWTWTCRQHAHQWLIPGGQKALENFVCGYGGHFDLQFATVNIELQSQQQAEIFCNFLKNTGQKFHISITLGWNIASRRVSMTF